VKSHPVTPQPIASGKRDDKQQHFNDHRVSQSHARSDRGLEARQVFGRDKPPVRELLDGRFLSLMDEELRGDQERERAKETERGASRSKRKGTVTPLRV
jgi:hypothetical protein